MKKNKLKYRKFFKYIRSFVDRTVLITIFLFVFLIFFVEISLKRNDFIFYFLMVIFGIIVGAFFSVIFLSIKNDRLQNDNSDKMLKMTEKFFNLSNFQICIYDGEYDNDYFPSNIIDFKGFTKKALNSGIKFCLLYKIKDIGEIEIDKFLNYENVYLYRKNNNVPFYFAIIDMGKYAKVKEKCNKK